MSQFILSHMSRVERVRDIITRARIAHMFTGDMQTRAFDALQAHDDYAQSIGDTRTSRHVARYVKFFSRH